MVTAASFPNGPSSVERKSLAIGPSKCSVMVFVDGSTVVEPLLNSAMCVTLGRAASKDARTSAIGLLNHPVRSAKSITAELSSQFNPISSAMA